MLKKAYNGMIIMIFTGYIMYLGTTVNNVSAKVLFIIVGIFMLSIFIYYEYLKSIYSKMINLLTMETDITLAKQFRTKLQRKDFTNGFKHSIILFDSLLLLDEGRYEDCLNHMNKEKRFFCSTIDYLFIYYHNQLMCYYFLNERENALAIIQKLMEIKKLNKKKYNPLFSWDEIDGIRYSLEGRNKKSLQSFEKVQESQLNKREKTYLYFLIANCYKSLKEIQLYGEKMKIARNYGNSLAIMGEWGNETFKLGNSVKKRENC